MENKEELYNKIPFYMTYPIQNLYMAEMEYEKDMERMKELYPREIEQIQRMIEKRCDELEYEGSRLYDENPDRYMMEEEARRLYERFLKENPQYRHMAPRPEPMPRPETVSPPESMPRPEPRTRRFSILPPEEFRDMIPEPVSMEENVEQELVAHNREGCENSWLCSLMQVIFNDEVYRRRCRHRRCRRWSM